MRGPIDKFRRTAIVRVRAGLSAPRPCQAAPVGWHACERLRVCVCVVCGT